MDEYAAAWTPFYEQKSLDEIDAIVAATAVVNAGNPDGGTPITATKLKILNFLVDAGGFGEEHCSGFAARGSATQDGKLYQGFNWDSNSVSANLKAYFEVVAFYQPEGKHSFVAPILPGDIGVYSGMNSEKLSIDSQASGGVHVAGYMGYEPYRPTINTIRKGLETASTIDDMQAVLTEQDAWRLRGLIAVIASKNYYNQFAVSETVGNLAKLRRTFQDVIYAANRFALPYWQYSWVTPQLTEPPDTEPNDRENMYEYLLTDFYQNDPFNGINLDISTYIMGYKDIDDLTDDICRVNMNGSSVVYVPEDGHIYVSAVESAPACGSGNYIGFDLDTQSPLQ